MPNKKKTKEFATDIDVHRKELDWRKRIGTCRNIPNGFVEIDGKITRLEDWINFIEDIESKAKQKQRIELLEEINKELFDIPYLCPFCVERQTYDGECICNCHKDEHIEEYEKQLKERLFNLLNKKGDK